MKPVLFQAETVLTHTSDLLASIRTTVRTSLVRPTWIAEQRITDADAFRLVPASSGCLKIVLNLFSTSLATSSFQIPYQSILKVSVQKKIQNLSLTLVTCSYCNIALVWCLVLLLTNTWITKFDEIQQYAL